MGGVGRTPQQQLHGALHALRLKLEEAERNDPRDATDITAIRRGINNAEEKLAARLLASLTERAETATDAWDAALLRAFSPLMRARLAAQPVAFLVSLLFYTLWRELVAPTPV